MAATSMANRDSFTCNQIEVGKLSISNLSANVWTFGMICKTNLYWRGTIKPMKIMQNHIFRNDSFFLQRRNISNGWYFGAILILKTKQQISQLFKLRRLNQVSKQSLCTFAMVPLQWHGSINSPNVNDCKQMRQFSNIFPLLFLSFSFWITDWFIRDLMANIVMLTSTLWFLQKKKKTDKWSTDSFGFYTSGIHFLRVINMVN